MLEKVLSLSPDLKRLRDEGYEIEVKQGNIIIYNVPYLNSKGTVLKGILISPLTLNNNIASYKHDGNHTVFFQGEIPYGADGKRMDSIYHSPVSKVMSGIPVNHMFSNKPKTGYQDYFHKMKTYVTILLAEAQAIDESITAATYKRLSCDDESPFVYVDTNSSRAAITDVSNKLSDLKIGIIGLGGTGAYILDQVAKTPVKEIHLFDGDIFCQHNAYRAPGAADKNILQQQPMKTDYFKSIYDNMHRHIFSHPQNITADNMVDLLSLDFVFLAIDSGPVKKDIIMFLVENHKSLIDTGIDVQYIKGQLLGLSRVTVVSEENIAEALQHISFEKTDNDIYQSNIQISDMNAFCAVTAVMEWKKCYGFYQSISPSCNINYTTNDGEFK